MLIKFLFSAICLFLSLITGLSQNFEFTQNKGQWPSAVLFQGNLSTGAFFLHHDGYRVLQHDTAAFHAVMDYYSGHTSTVQSPSGQAAINPQDRLTVPSHAYDVKFLNASPKVSVITERPMVGYSNYFIGDDPSRWASEVQSFGGLLYQQLYPGIDLRYYSENGYLKYDLIVQPNANLNQLVMRYEGIESLKVENGELLVKTSVNTVREQYPYSYQVINGQRQTVKCQYQVIGNDVRYKLSGYDPGQVLVIDPTLVFSSFTGSTADNWGYTATYDRLGNLYAGGIVFGNNYPVTTGAFQSGFAGGGSTGENGGFDIGVMKFNTTGTQRVYATYIGGNDNEQPHSLIVDPQGNLIMAGRSRSTNYPTTSGVIGSGGLWDIIVSKLNATGTAMLASVRIGGSQDDGVNIKHKYPASGPSSLQRNYGDDARSEVILDGAGNIYVASCTQSGNFPITGGAFQSTKAAMQDALVLKFNSNLGLSFASFLGGEADDAAYVLGLAPNNDVLVAGGTSSLSFPGNKAGTVGPNFTGGLADGFIARISNNGSTLVRSTYIGTAGIDQIYGIQFDLNGFVYVQGTSTGNFPVRNAAFSQAGGKQFIAKLQSDFSAYVYSTVWGTNAVLPNISPIAFLVDRCENVYVSGWGGTVIETNPAYAVSGTSGLTATPDAIKANTDGRDFYFFVLEKNAVSQLFGSFFGQQDATRISDHVDGGTSRFDEDGIIYQALCANCQGGQYPTTPGVIAPSNPSGRCNEAVVKIAFELSGVRGGVKAGINNVEGDTTGCVPLTVQFRDTVRLARRYEWSFSDGTGTQFTTVPNTTHTFNTPGNYLVRMIAIDTTKCYPRDTTYVTIRARTDQAVLQAQSIKLPPCESNNFRFENQSIAPAGKPFGANSFTWIFGDGSPNVVAGAGPVLHAFPGPGTYNVRLVLTDTTYCNAPDTLPLTLRVSPNVDALFETPVAGCAPYNAVFNNTSAGGTFFTWFFGDGTTSTQASPVKFYGTPGIYTVKLIAVDSGTCNLIDSVERTITVSGKPTSNFSFSPNPPEENIITTFTNLATGATRYLWLFGDGDSLQTIRQDTLVRHQYRETGTYNACLVAINQFGCPDTFCLPVPIIINPLIDVVSAFTPNNDGTNDRAIVIGYGIEKMTFRIYNRWGQLVFESGDVSQGWDGKFKGRAQPMDAYAYTLEARMVSGEMVRKSGNITLVR